jgi:hypothetical protein
MSTKTNYVLLNEGIVSSAISDIVTIGTLVGAFWFNYQFVDGNNLLDILIIILWFLFLLQHTNGRSRRFNSKQKLIDYLQEEI